MSKKYYVLIAKAICDATRIDWPDSVKKSSFIDKLCLIFAEDNYLFNRDKFEEACGMIPRAKE